MRGKLEIVLPSAVILVAETLLFLGNAWGDLALHAVNVILCIVLAVMFDADAPIFQAFSLVSILRILNLSVPTFSSLTLYNYPFIYGIAIIATYIMIRESEGVREQLGRAARWMRQWIAGLRHTTAAWLIFLPAGVLAGYLISNVEFVLIHPQNLIALNLPDLTVLAIIMVFFVGFGEELIFRAALQKRLRPSIGFWGSILAASIIFAAMHAGYANALYLAFVFAVGIMLGYLYFRTRSLAFVSLIHGAINFFLFSYLPLGQLRLF
jgi:membrane protease YdiL (CAAX protease family)